MIIIVDSMKTMYAENNLTESLMMSSENSSQRSTISIKLTTLCRAYCDKFSVLRFLKTDDLGLKPTEPTSSYQSVSYGTQATVSNMPISGMLFY